MIVDASVVVAALIDSGSNGEWARSVLRTRRLVAPHVLPVEASHSLRRAELHGHISADIASQAHAEIESVPIVLYPYSPLARRIWELRSAVTPYDAWYVALAEGLAVPLATLDVRLTKAPGTRCEFITP